MDARGALKMMWTKDNKGGWRTAADMSPPGFGAPGGRGRRHLSAVGRARRSSPSPGRPHQPGLEIARQRLNSTITDWNPAAERLFGYRRDDALGRSITMLIPDALKDKEEAIIRRFRAGERIESFETTRLRKTARRFRSP